MMSPRNRRNTRILTQRCKGEKAQRGSADYADRGFNRKDPMARSAEIGADSLDQRIDHGRNDAPASTAGLQNSRW